MARSTVGASTKRASPGRGWCGSRVVAVGVAQPRRVLDHSNETSGPRLASFLLRFAQPGNAQPVPARIDDAEPAHGAGLLA
jgi:hypothetical protein